MPVGPAYGVECIGGPAGAAGEQAQVLDDRVLAQDGPQNRA